MFRLTAISPVTLLALDRSALVLYQEHQKFCRAGHVSGYCGTKAARGKLRKSEANLAAAQRIAHLGSLEQELSNLDDLEKNPLYWSDEVFRVFGYEPGEIEVSRANFLRGIPPR